jgi:hypothetical protein
MGMSCTEKIEIYFIAAARADGSAPTIAKAVDLYLDEGEAIARMHIWNRAQRAIGISPHLRVRVWSVTVLAGEIKEVTGE